MAYLYLSDLANWLREAGLNVFEYGNWQHKSRGGTGYSSMPLCVMWHHTATPATWDGAKDASYIADGDEDAPLANLYIDRAGTVWVLAAGATNTNGKGKSIQFSRGTVPQDGMNSRALGVEMGNDGIGEPWPQVQVDAMFAVSNTCNARFGNVPSDLSTHNFYAPDRKIDPATAQAVQGVWIPSSCNSSGSWDVESIKGEASVRAGGSYTPPIPPTQEDWWTPVINSMPTLRPGHPVAGSVKVMQHLMCSVGAMNEANVSNYDGVFGPGTESALNNWKRSIGGSADSTCDSWTWGALMHTIDGVPNLERGNSGPDVKRMQHLLAANGYMDEGNTQNYDGDWGNGTDNAKKRFDDDHGLGGSDTSCGPKSWQSLLTGLVW